MIDLSGRNSTSRFLFSPLGDDRDTTKMDLTVRLQIHQIGACLTFELKLGKMIGKLTFSNL